ncbi:MAG: hypothetical protein AAFX79_08040 [Planctomycetota bacterium]
MLLALQDIADPAAAAPTEVLDGSRMQWLLIAAGIAILVWVMMRLQWKRRRRGEDESPVHQMREYVDARAQESERAGEMAAIVADLAARLENRADRLEVLLEQADERIQQLEARLGSSVRPLGSLDAHPVPHPQRAEASWSADGPEASSGDAEDAASADPLREDVYALADRGRSPLEIARELDQQVGTIELILALRQKPA